MARCKNTDMLIGAIKKAAGGNVQTSSDTARKLATEMGGMRHGGKPVKKAVGGPLGANGKPLSNGQMQRAANAPTAAQQKTWDAWQATRPKMSDTVNYSGPEGRAARLAYTALSDAWKAKQPGFTIGGPKGVENRPMYSTPAPSAQDLARTAEKAARRAPATAMTDGTTGAAAAGAGGATGENVGSDGMPLKNGGRPVKKARGGAGKVRKGMMSPDGAILQAVKPKKGVGGM